MDIREAQAELENLRGLAKEGEDLALFRGRIERLYLAVLRKPLRRCKCKNILQDALAEIYSILKRKTKMGNTKAKLVKGVILRLDGKIYTNNNLTDNVAREFLKRFPQRTDWFEELPSDEVKVPAIETPAEDAPAELEEPVDDKPVKAKRKRSKRSKK